MGSNSASKRTFDIIFERPSGNVFFNVKETELLKQVISRGLGWDCGKSNTYCNDLEINNRQIVVVSDRAIEIIFDGRPITCAGFNFPLDGLCKSGEHDSSCVKISLFENDLFEPLCTIQIKPNYCNSGEYLGVPHSGNIGTNEQMEHVRSGTKISPERTPPVSDFKPPFDFTIFASKKDTRGFKFTFSDAGRSVQLHAHIKKTFNLFGIEPCILEDVRYPEHPYISVMLESTNQFEPGGLYRIVEVETIMESISDVTQLTDIHPLRY